MLTAPFSRRGAHPLPRREELQFAQTVFFFFLQNSNPSSSVVFLQMSSSSSSSRSRHVRRPLRCSFESSASDHVSVHTTKSSDSEATHVAQEAPAAPPAPVDRPDWVPPHPWLAFPQAIEGVTPPMMYRHISYLRGCVHCTIASLDLQDAVTRSLLELVEDHLTYEVHDAQGTLVLTDPSFGNLVSSVESTYHLLCLEFFASMEMDNESIDYADEQFISFRLGGVRRYCSLFEFGRRLGLYPATAAQSLVFQHHLATSLSTSSDDFDPVAFWPTVGEGEYHSEILVSSLRSTAHRFLARYIFYLILLHVY